MSSLRCACSILAVVCALSASATWSRTIHSGGSVASKPAALRHDTGDAAGVATCPTCPRAIGAHTSQASHPGSANSLPSQGTQTHAVSAPLQLSLTIDDGTEFVQLGKVVSYRVDLRNEGATAVSAVPVTFALSSGFDGAATQWHCDGANIVCQQDPGNPLRYSVSLPSNGVATWRIDVPVLGTTTESDVTFSAAANGDTPVLDVNTLVVLRDGFEGTAVQPVLDSGFELSLGNNGPWLSTSTSFGTSLCDVAYCGNGGGSAGPHGGNVWVWFGGTNQAETGTASQVLTIPAGGPRHLNFWLRAGLVADGSATLGVSVDGVEVAEFHEPESDEAGYTQRSVDISAYADGASHKIEFRYTKPATSGSSNFSVDDVTIDAAPAPAVAPTSVMRSAGDSAQRRSR